MFFLIMKVKPYFFIFSMIVKDLPPTPSKFHYIFNLRDLSRIYSGLCLSTPDRFKKPEHFLRLWRNECLRVFSDRLIIDTDKDMISVSLISTVLVTFVLQDMNNLKRILKENYFALKNKSKKSLYQ